MTAEQIFGLGITIIMGLGWGSFSTMATYRIPRGMPWIGDEPRCFMCKHTLNIIDYFSILSYFIHRGTCRYCKGKYEENIGYFLTELSITVLFVLCYLQFNFGDYFFLYTSMIVACVILAVVDAEHGRIPSKILISLLLIGAVARTFVDKTFYGGLYGGLCAGIVGLAIRHVFFILKGQASVGSDYMRWQHEDRFVGPGFDYVKMLAIVGVWLNFDHLAVYIPLVGALTLGWYVISPKTLRPGAVMAGFLILFLLYPAVIDRLGALAFGG